MNLLFLFMMIFFHIWDDFHMQGILADMKQKSWWEKQSEYSLKYSKDYIPALLAHSFSWAFVMMFPVMIGAIVGVVSVYGYAVCLVANIAIHAYVDNLKANKMEINLIEDQTIHLIQIFCTWAVFFLL